MIAAALTLWAALQGVGERDAGLSNDSYLGVRAEAQQWLETGDTALARATERDADPRQEQATWDAWQRALDESEAGDVVEVEGSHALGIVYAVRERLDALDDRQLREWRARHEPPAGQALEDAGFDGASLARVERNWPATRSALRAALLLGDVALEEGRREHAHAWWNRATWHAGKAAEPGWGPALATRLATLAALAGPAPDPETPLDRAVGLSGGRQLELVDRGLLYPGYQPGLTLLDDGTAAVQCAPTAGRGTRGSWLVISFDLERGQRTSSFDAASLLEGATGHLLAAPRPVERSAPAWALHPLSSGRSLFLVVGRTRGGRANALMRVEPAGSGNALDLGGVASATFQSLPTLGWAIQGDSWTDASGETTRPALLEGLDEAEIQPGPVLWDTTLIAQFKAASDETRAWLLAFDAATGEPLWRTFLAKGSDLLPGRARFSAGLALHAAQPLVLSGERVFAGTHLGAGLLVDALDGRTTWAYRNRRRDPRQSGWTGQVRPATSSGAKAALLFAPYDSDALAWLAPGPAPAAGPQLRPARVLSEAETLAGGAVGEAVVLGRAGPRAAASLWTEQGRFDSIHLARGERFTGRGLLTDRRLVFSTDRGLYLLDRDRQLYLLDVVPIAARPPLEGTSLHASGERVLLLATDQLRLFGLR